MTLDEILKAIIDNGVTVGVLIYFMWSQNQTLKELRDALTKLTDSINKLLNRDDTHE